MRYHIVGMALALGLIAAGRLWTVDPILSGSIAGVCLMTLAGVIEGLVASKVTAGPGSGYAASKLSLADICEIARTEEAIYWPIYIANPDFAPCGGIFLASVKGQPVIVLEKAEAA